VGIKIKNGGKMVDYKELDKNIILWSLILFILAIIIGILSSKIGALISTFGTIGIIFWYLLIAFTSVYIIWSFLFWIVGLISIKARENYKFKLMVKSGTAIVFTIMVIFSMSMPICAGGNCGGRNTTPLKNANQLLRNQIDNPGAESCTDVVTFQKDISLVAQGITKDTGLDYSQVYFDNPEGIPNFDVSNHSVLKYTETSKKNVTMCIICDDGKTGLQEAAIQNGINTTIDSNIEGETLCLVYPKKAV